MDDVLYQQKQLTVPKPLILFCTGAVFIFALTKFWIGTKISAYFEAAFLLPFYYIVFKHWWYFKKSKMTWLCIAMIAVPVLQFLVQYYQDPLLAMKYQGVDKLFRLTFFLGAAFWLSYNLKLVPWFIASNLTGLFLLLLSQDNLDRLVDYTFAGERTPWGKINSQFAATYASIGLLATISILSFRFKKRSTKLNTAFGILTALLISTLIIVMFASQARAAVGGLALGLLVALLLFVRVQKITYKAVFFRPLSVLFGTLLITGLFFSLLTQPTTSAKITSDWTIFTSNQSGFLPDQFGGGRGELWKFGSSQILEKPLVGWGGEARKDLISQSKNLSNRTRTFLLHMHNSWLEFGVSYGVAGFLLLTCLILTLFKKTIRNWQHHRIPNTPALFGISSLVFTCVVNIFESYLFFWQGGYLLTWTAAPVFAYMMYNVRYNNQSAPLC